METLAGLPRGSLVKRWFGRSPLAAADSWELGLRLDLGGLPHDPSLAVESELDAALRTAGIGRAEIGGGLGTTGPDGRSVPVATLYDLLVRDDLPRAVALVGDVLDRHRARQNAVLRHDGPGGATVPLCTTPG
ncbi:hypothetical protein [Streptomyces sp. NPDC051921]|uniref:hypothetical protein n=1 Tax=Streptomyces sp. NPDC051921 TaxID=3155806 RepID=UPI0034472EE8